MSLRSRLDEDLKQAMRDRNVARRDVLRYLKSEIHNQEIASQKTLDDDGIQAVLVKQAQQRRDSIEAFRDAGRSDLVDNEETGLAIVMEYLPQQMSPDEIKELALAVVEEVGAAGPGDMGKVMGALVRQTRGRANGREVSQVVREILASL